jgi:uncharacterized protein (DUF1330 family)
VSYYAVVHNAIEDLERYRRDYIPDTVEIIAKHGGEIVAAAEPRPIEGTPPGPRMVILKFSSEETFRDFYNDPDYQPLKELRLLLSSSGSMVGAPSFRT